jgi:predicted ATPase/DNA-binding winged helix-turn-helix (wHTH) protein
VSSKPALSIVGRDRSAREDTAPRAPLTLATRQNSAATSIRFGAFCLWPVRRLLLQHNQPVRIGSRALDILIALLERAGDLVTKDELMSRVWPNTFVEPANLTVHIAALRRALGDGRDGNRFLINIPGRGYRFVAPVTLSEQFKPSLRATFATGESHNLPARVTRLIGRQDVVGRLASQITQDRFLTVVGPGGIGKTAVALAVAEEVAASYRHGTWWVDLAASENPQQVAGAVASVLGLELDGEKFPANLVTPLRDKEILLVLDTCERVVATVAGLVAAIMREAPGVHVLATSREPLHSEGERLCRLAGLESPLTDCASAEQAVGFPAIELFVERATATVREFTLGDADAATVSDICRTLDGIPLAIELVARRVGSLGIAELAAALEAPQLLLTSGYRTGPARQHTMRASLVWSHDLLTDKQQVVLRRLSIFPGEFTLCDAVTVVSDRAQPACDIIDEVSELVAKSFIASDMREAQPRFRLTHITRAYALEKLRESGELDATARRLADYLKAPVRRPATARKLMRPPHHKAVPRGAVASLTYNGWKAQT